MATPVEKERQNLTPEEINACRQTTTALRTRLQALLQSTHIVRRHSGYSGKLNAHKLHKLCTGNAKIFLQQGERQQLNTAVHILLDSSGSMMGAAMPLACHACFAVASALYGIKGISLGITTFPGGKFMQTGNNNKTPSATWDTVSPILTHSQQRHKEFNIPAAGDTPMDAALLWTLQQVHPLSENRKIILIITDGSPNNFESAEQAITMVKQCGIEIYGIGISDVSIAKLLPGKESIIINSIPELAPTMFGLLQNALLTI